MDELLELQARFRLPNPGSQMVQDYKEKVKSEAEELVLNQFPKKILDLEALLNTEKFSWQELSAVQVDINIPVPEAVSVFNHSSEENSSKKRKLQCFEDNIPGTKVLILPEGTVPLNSRVTELVDLVKPWIRQLVEDTNLMKMWIQFLIPRIEDGNNFGVSIQEDTLGEIRTVESEAAAYFDQVSRYYLTRAKVIAKVAKYPHIEDYRRTVRELDEKEYLSLRLVVSELRNHYATLHDLITKNLEKIKKPRNCNLDTMY